MCIIELVYQCTYMYMPCMYSYCFAAFHVLAIHAHALSYYTATNTQASKQGKWNEPGKETWTRPGIQVYTMFCRHQF